MAGYDRNLEQSKKISNINVKKERGERFLNLDIYSYNSGAWKIRVKPVNLNTNPNADSNKKWINCKSISSITIEEAEELIKGLTIAIEEIKLK